MELFNEGTTALILILIIVTTFWMLTMMLTTLKEIMETLGEVSKLLHQGYSDEHVESSDYGSNVEAQEEEYSPSIQQHVTQREEAFDVRIARINKEIEEERPLHGTEATPLHPDTYNLPNNRIYTSPPPDEEYSI